MKLRFKKEKEKRSKVEIESWKYCNETAAKNIFKIENWKRVKGLNTQVWRSNLS